MFTGLFVNFGAVIAGSLIGIFFRGRLNQKYQTALLDVIILGVIGIGVKYIIGTKDPLVLVISLITGTLIGTLLKIDDRLDSLGGKLQSKLKNKQETFSEGFAGASILYCVGSMAIMGCLQCALEGKSDILLTKSLMDGVTSVFLASALGIGVLFSAFSVLIYQGLLILLFYALAGGIADEAVVEMSAVGGAILIGIAINMLKLKKLKTADMVISLFMPLAVIPLMKLIS
jgi:uncharacterized membrane protein YqgA involved in biofilm formation